ncbi:hypothetical protein FGB62_1g267 [Gracilaria domingensis]|nr:hypothetical protein FGB62_1g267 [Gracilaria domingensis]
MSVTWRVALGLPAAARESDTGGPEGIGAREQRSLAFALVELASQTVQLPPHRSGGTRLIEPAADCAPHDAAGVRARPQPPSSAAPMRRRRQPGAGDRPR